VDNTRGRGAEDDSGHPSLPHVCCMKCTPAERHDNIDDEGEMDGDEAAYTSIGGARAAIHAAYTEYGFPEAPTPWSDPGRGTARGAIAADIDPNDIGGIALGGWSVVREVIARGGHEG